MIFSKLKIDFKKMLFLKVNLDNKLVAAQANIRRMQSNIDALNAKELEIKEKIRQAKIKTGEIE